MHSLSAHTTTHTSAPPAQTSMKKSKAGFTLVEVVVAVAVLTLTAVGVTQALLQLNRQAALSRVTNAAKAEAISQIQQISQCAYNPDAVPPVIPTILNVGTRTQQADLGSKQTDLGSIPATITTTVAAVPGGAGIRSVRCTVAYTYLGRNLSYELFTYKSPD